MICTGAVNKAVSLTDVPVPLHQKREPSVTLTQFYSEPHFSRFQEKAHFHVPIRTSGETYLLSA